VAQEFNSGRLGRCPSERYPAQFTTPGSKSRPNERSPRIKGQGHDRCFGMSLHSSHEFTIRGTEEKDVALSRPTSQSLAVQEPHFRKESHLVTCLGKRSHVSSRLGID
jgi:hypothetical protein